MKAISKILALVLCMAIVVSLSACSGGADKVPEQDTTLMDKATRLLQAEGRAYDKLYTGQLNETITSAFFEFKISSATTAAELEGYTPQTEGYQFVIVDVEVKNIFDQTIPVGNYDFDIYWNGGEDYAYEAFLDDMYPDEVELTTGESISGKLVFEVPADAADVMIGYTEIWDDDFKGNVYLISLGF